MYNFHTKVSAINNIKVSYFLILIGPPQNSLHEQYNYKQEQIYN